MTNATTTHALLQWLLALAAISSAALLLILPLRPLLRRLGGPTLAYGAWALLPLALLATALPHPAAEPMRWAAFHGVTAAQPDHGPAMAMLPEQPLLGDNVWLSLWCCGGLLLLAAMAWQQWRFQHSLGLARPVPGRRVLRASRADAGPLVLGLLRPRIVLPADFRLRYSGTEQALILAHEAAHLRHGDLAVNALAALLQILFWFNPLVHLAAARLRLDQELACDHAVLRRHPQRRQAYAHAILKTQLAASAAPTTLLPMACHWQPRHPLKERIMQLSRPAPSRVQRRAVQTLLLAGTLAVGYGAWAAVADLAPVPVVAATPAVPAAAASPATEPMATAAPASSATPVLAAALPATVGVAQATAVPATPAVAKVAAVPTASQAVAAAQAVAAPDAAALATAPAPAQAAAPVNGMRIESEGVMRSHGGTWGKGSSAEWAPNAQEVADKLQAGPAKDGSPRYKVVVDHSTTTAGQTHTHNFALGLAANESGTVTVNDGQHQCKFTLKVNPHGDNAVALDMPVDCDDGQHHPRVITRLGEAATIAFGREDGTLQKFTLVVTAPSS
jgi:beta-lactamase regulating signal transducer with metallopeptidase domain